MKQRIIKKISTCRYEIVAGSLGAITGFSYWYFACCSTGNCAITSNPFMSTAYGALVGGMLPGILIDKRKRTKQETK